MKRSGSFFCLVLLAAFGLSGCREKAQAPASPSANAAVSPAPGANLPAATVSTSPLPPGTVNPNQAIAPGQAIDLKALPEQMRRPLTLEEIKNLPPESRDVILKAIGQPVPTASPKK